VGVRKGVTLYILESVLLQISPYNAERIEQHNYFQRKPNGERIFAIVRDTKVYGILQAELLWCLISVVNAVNNELHALAALPEGKFSQYPPDRRLSVPQGWSVRFGETKSLYKSIIKQRYMAVHVL
jgi:hypothetical protein